ncbi:MAG: phosphate acyltransferase PlsX [Phycisphaeraceae bacterium]|nr:phosphate acyltransferase PlsX [Phycisphaeraceae bacterium]MCW5754125.1 phosphate acyltransferase PlsX [Phycisphaeraceae bacterium]
MRIAIDVMGGDHAPDAILKGALDALDVIGPADELVLVGQPAVIEDVLRERRIVDSRVVVEPASEIIGMGDKAAQAVRGKPESSIVKMALLGSRKAQRPVDVCLSAGNTGACVAAAIMHMKRMPGVHRPGIAVTIPALVGPVVLCDAGANPEPLPSHLWQYGVMASTYAQHVLGIATPRVAVMNIGSEEGKGSDLVRSAHDLLKQTPGINYIGNVEGRDLFDGAADVVITDGFVGNTLLKMAEGLAASLLKAIAHEVAAADPELILQLEPVIRRIYKKNDYHEYGGAPLLGVNGAFMIAHGSSEARTIRAAIRNSRDFVATGVNEAIRRRIAEIEGLTPSPTEEHA